MKNEPKTLDLRTWLGQLAKNRLGVTCVIPADIERVLYYSLEPIGKNHNNWDIYSPLEVSGSMAEMVSALNREGYSAFGGSNVITQLRQGAK